jgi:hypothetical protein
MTTTYTRSFALDDISLKPGDGRTVDAYATVFDVATNVSDEDGKYEEINDRTMYNRAVADAAPAGSRQSWKVGVFYNHGRTIFGTPSDLYSMPVGVPLDIKPDGKGLFTRTRYASGPLGDTIIEGIKEGFLTSYSVSGAFLRSSPEVPRGGFRRSRDGKLPTVRRLGAGEVGRGSGQLGAQGGGPFGEVDGQGQLRAGQCDDVHPHPVGQAGERVFAEVDQRGQYVAFARGGAVQRRDRVHGGAARGQLVVDEDERA